MTAIPADLVEWFAGEKVDARRHGLPRLAVVWRVMTVLGILGDDYVAEADLREFKTELGAHQYAERLSKAGQTVLTQVGITIWLDPHELPGEVR